MRVPQSRVNARTAADKQCADATLLQHAVWSLLRSGITARMRQALMSTLVYQIRLYGGRMQAEAVGSRASVNARRTGQDNSNARQSSKELELISSSLVFTICIDYVTGVKL